MRSNDVKTLLMQAAHLTIQVEKGEQAKRELARIGRHNDSLLDHLLAPFEGAKIVLYASDGDDAGVWQQFKVVAGKLQIYDDPPEITVSDLLAPLAAGVAE